MGRMPFEIPKMILNLTDFNENDILIKFGIQEVCVCIGSRITKKWSARAVC